MKLQELVHIEQRYQDSVNIRLDLYDNEKLKQYLPTTASLAVCGEYLENILKNKNNSTMLIGPYGKGKSHLILVLLRLLAKKKSSGDENAIKEVIEKAKKTEEMTASKMEEVINRQKPYLPVIITYGNEDLNTTYIYALVRALIQEGLSDLAPDSVFERAIEKIEEWKKHYPDTYQTLGQLLKNQPEENDGKGNHVTENPPVENDLKETEKNRQKKGEYATIEDLTLALRRHQKAAYVFFKELYPGLTSGSRFEPMLENSAMKLYEEADEILRKHYGYAGIFLVFDEFGKYMEMQDLQENQLSGNMGIIQEMCELCNQKSNQMHHIFIAHKTMKEYGTHLRKETIDAFTGVEGRLREVPFFTTVKNNYELIAQSISKSEDSNENIYGDLTKLEVIRESYHIPAFYTGFSEEEFQKTVAFGCFPLLPVTSCLLLKISEKTGQNERSLFTFLARDEQNTLARHILENGRIPLEEQDFFEKSLVTPQKVYDYFSVLFYKEYTMEPVYGEYQKSRFVISKIEKEYREQKTELEKNGQQKELFELTKKKNMEQNIVKSLALIHMASMPEELNADRKTLFLCGCWEKEDFYKALKELEDKGYLLWRKKANAYQFRNQIAVDVDEKIRETEQHLGNFDLGKELKKISVFQYELPKAYNHKYAMTRYFDYVYIEESTFLKTKISYVREWFVENFSDGKLIAVLPDRAKDQIQNREKLIEKLKEWNSERILMLLPTETLELKHPLRKYLAIQKYRKSLQEEKEDNELLLEELECMLEDCEFEIISRLKRMYLPYNGKCEVYHKDKKIEPLQSRKQFHELLSKICEDYYKNTPVIRHEMINRRNLSLQMKKARTNLIKEILGQGDIQSYEKGTAPEATIFRASLLRTGLVGDTFEKDSSSEKILEEITAFMKKASNKKKVSFSEIYEVLLGKGYGVRLGVIPIYLAYRFSKLEDLPVVYRNGKEYLLDAEVLNQINQEPEQYQLYIETYALEKEDYIKRLGKCFQCPKSFETAGDKNQIAVLGEEILQWYRSLSRYARRGEYIDVLEKEKDKNRDVFMKKFCHILQTKEMNPREFFYERLPQICMETSFVEIAEKLIDLKKWMEESLDRLLQEVLSITKSAFGGKHPDSLHALLKDWHQRADSAKKTQIADRQQKAFLSGIREISEWDPGKGTDYSIISRLSRILVDLYIEDWNVETIDYYKERLYSAVEFYSLEKKTDPEENNGKKEVYFTAENGDRVHKYFDAEIEGTAVFMENEMKSVIDEFGESMEQEQIVAVLVKLLEEAVI